MLRGRCGDEQPDQVYTGMPCKAAPSHTPGWVATCHDAGRLPHCNCTQRDCGTAAAAAGWHEVQEGAWLQGRGVQQARKEGSISACRGRGASRASGGDEGANMTSNGCHGGVVKHQGAGQLDAELSLQAVAELDCRVGRRGVGYQVFSGAQCIAPAQPKRHSRAWCSTNALQRQHVQRKL